MTVLWFHIQGEYGMFNVSVSPNTHVADLKRAIHKEGSSRSFVGYDAKDLILTRVLYHDLYVNTIVTTVHYIRRSMLSALP
jgi:hypothetical protein